MPNPTTIMILRPMKHGDATSHTYLWGQKSVVMARDLGYNVIDIQKDDVTYDNVSNAIQKYQPRLIATFSHGCVNSIQGQNECVIARKYKVEEIVEMALSGDTEKVNIAKALLNPLHYLSNPNLCQLQNDPCDLYCLHDSNVELLKDKIVFATACFSSYGLGKCAIAHGGSAYDGADDLFLFPVDSRHSQDIFGNLQLIGLREVLLGHSIGDADALMSEEEDKLITKFKPIKYMALSMLWNKLHRKTLGNLDATIY